MEIHPVNRTKRIAACAALVVIAAVALRTHAPAVETAAGKTNGLECTTTEKNTWVDGTVHDSLSGTFRLELLPGDMGKFHFQGVDPSPSDMVRVTTVGTTYVVHNESEGRTQEATIIDRETGKLHRLRDFSDLAHHPDDTKYAETFGTCHAITIQPNM